jgi:hypothetical protein
MRQVVLLSSGGEEDSEDEDSVEKVPTKRARMLKSRCVQTYQEPAALNEDVRVEHLLEGEEKKPQVMVRRLHKVDTDSLIACADSGAEEHIINRVNCFVPGTFVEYSAKNPAPIDLLTANGQSMPVLGRGDISEHIKGAYYVPSSQSLVSLPRLRENNQWAYMLPKNISPDYSMLIFDQHGSLIMVADDEGNINFDFECPKFQTLFQDFKPLIDMVSSMGARKRNI